MKTLNELKQELEAKRSAAAERIKEKLETRKVMSQLKLLDNEKFQDALVIATESQQTSDQLQDMIDQCTEIVASMPILNTKTRENRKFLNRPRYGFGRHVELLTGLLSGIRYSATDHKNIMLQSVNLNDYIIDKYLDAMGSNPYFSENYNTIIDGVKVNLPDLLEAINLIETTLNITIDKSKLTQKNFDNQFSIETAKAQLKLEEYQDSEGVDDKLIKID